jgi:glycosyltransferase involved in cell wall biosynthesis
MNILLANSTCKVGGVSTFLLSLRQELLALGHQCELFFFERGTMEPFLPADGSVHFGNLADLLRLVERRQIAVVHANNVDWPTGISAVRRLGAKLILTAHKVREPAWTYGWNAGNCDALVAVSRWVREALQPFTDADIQVVHNGTDTGRFRPCGDDDPAGRPTEPPIVAWVGRGSAAVKRLEAFAAAAPALRRAGLRIRVIDQQGPEQFARMHPEAAAALVATAEFWRGVPFEEMPRTYHEIAASGGCVVSTASMEGFGLTLIEAQACGCAIVAADVAGVNECVSPRWGGVLYPLASEPASLGALILEVLRKPGEIRARGREAAAHVAATFSLRRMTEQYLNIYADAPYPACRAHLRQRLRHSLLLHWPAYLDERLGVGYAQYEASRELAGHAETRLAIAAARASLATAPTMYAHPARLAHLVRVSSRAARALTGQADGQSLAPNEKRTSALGTTERRNG